jgi:antitoxin component of MazEF toxin-antitoxin module
MPIIRKIIGCGTSKVVSIPKSWLEYWQRETGQEITEVAVEVNKVLIISPYLKEKQGRRKGETHE